MRLRRRAPRRGSAACPAAELRVRGPGWIVLAGAVLALAAGCGGSASGDRGDGLPGLVVAAASSLREPLSACGSELGGVAVRFSFAGSDELAAQIRRGVEPDVYAAADRELPLAIHEEGLLERPVAFATGELVVAVPEGSRIGSLADLARPGLELAIGSESVPAGAYAHRVLDRLPPGTREAILANVRSEEPDVKGVVGKLLQGAVDAGFTYRTDVEAARGELEAIMLPPGLSPGVVYAAGVVEGSERPREARAFVRGLRSGACAEALERAGFAPPPRGGR